MQEAQKYRNFATECRRLARAAIVGKERAQLLELANTWEHLAIERENFVLTHPELHARMLADQNPEPDIPEPAAGEGHDHLSGVSRPTS